MPGARCTRGLVCKLHRKCAHEQTGSAEAIRHSLRNGFNGFLRTLPGDRALLSPSLRRLAPRNLTSASRRQDHTTSPSASGALVRSAIRVHRIPPHVRDDRETPLVKGRDKADFAFDLGSRSTMPFATDWHDGQIRLIRLNKTAFCGNRGRLHGLTAIHAHFDALTA